MEETTLNENFSEELKVSASVKRSLKDAAKWARFIAIVGFAGLGLSVLSMILGSTLFSSMGSTMHEAPQGMGQMMQWWSGFSVVIVLVMALIYFFPLYYMYNFANKTLQSLKSNEQYSFERAFSHLRMLNRYVGILLIVVLAIYALMLLGLFLFQGLAG